MFMIDSQPYLDIDDKGNLPLCRVFRLGGRVVPARILLLVVVGSAVGEEVPSVLHEAVVQEPAARPQAAPAGARQPQSIQ